MDTVLYIADHYVFDTLYAKVWPSYTKTIAGHVVSSWPRDDFWRVNLSVYLITLTFATSQRDISFWKWCISMDVKAGTRKIFLATTNLHFVQHEFCSHHWVHLFSITGEFTFRNECITLGYAEVKPDDSMSNPELAVVGLIRLGIFGRTFILRKSNRRVIVIQYIGYTIIFYLASEQDEITVMADKDWWPFTEY
ncbi:hypothetical protein RMATCC62417_11401 [Rhizopus microsporus]|nr:hypothetical protein RMATCC62417_11401 [Rhizopus microsporus]